jgi:flagellar M-ring protein FliF
VALSPEEIEKLTALVKESIGFKQDRGDSVKVINAPFRVEPIDTSTLPWWKQPELIDILRASAVPAGLALVAMLVFFGMIRPSLKAALAPAAKPAPGSKIDTVVADRQTLSGPLEGAPPALEGPAMQHKLEQARRFTKENPAATANIVRGWVSGEAA